MFTAGAAVLGYFAEGSDCRRNTYGQGLFYCLQAQLRGAHSPVDCGLAPTETECRPCCQHIEKCSQHRIFILKVFAYSNIINMTCCRFIWRT